MKTKWYIGIVLVTIYVGAMVVTPTWDPVTIQIVFFCVGGFFLTVYFLTNRNQRKTIYILLSGLSFLWLLPYFMQYL